MLIMEVNMKITMHYFLVKWFPSPTNDVCEMFQTVWTNNITQTDKYVYNF